MIYRYLAPIQNPLRNVPFFDGGMKVTEKFPKPVGLNTPLTPSPETIFGLEVSFLDKLGSDLTVVNAARVSFNKRKEALDESDTKLLSYLLKHKHWSPFSHPQLSFHIKAPIFVARQLHKHMIGLNISLAHNEMSRRYVDDEPEFYEPQVWRKRPEEGIKQGSGEAFDENDNDYFYERYRTITSESAVFYRNAIKRGAAPEMARMLLPQNTLTEWIWTGSLAAFLRIMELRLDSHAQFESQHIAKQIEFYVSYNFPQSYEAWRGVSK